MNLCEVNQILALKTIFSLKRYESKNYPIFAFCSRSSMDRIVVSGTTDGGSNPSGSTNKAFYVV